MTRALVLIALFMFGLNAVGAPCDSRNAGVASLPQADLDILTETAAHRFRVWIAADEASRQHGLMHVPALAADRGMLFLFERAQFVAFWMKDTCISLDILFVATDGRIANIARDAEPFSSSPIPSSAPITGVLEIPGGSALRLGIVPGDRIRHPAFEAGQ